MPCGDFAGHIHTYEHEWREYLMNWNAIRTTHLQLHRLHGSQSEFHTVQVDYDNRIILTIQVSEREITLHDIGSHDEVYR